MGQENEVGPDQIHTSSPELCLPHRARSTWLFMLRSPRSLLETELGLWFPGGC